MSHLWLCIKIAVTQSIGLYMQVFYLTVTASSHLIFQRLFLCFSVLGGCSSSYWVFVGDISIGLWGPILWRRHEDGTFLLRWWPKICFIFFPSGIGTGRRAVWWPGPIFTIVFVLVLKETLLDICENGHRLPFLALALAFLPVALIINHLLLFIGDF